MTEHVADERIRAAVLATHLAYLRAGADILTANR